MKMPSPSSKTNPNEPNSLMTRTKTTLVPTKGYENEDTFSKMQNKPNLSRRSLLAKPDQTRSEAEIPAGGLLEILRPGTKQTQFSTAPAYTSQRKQTAHARKQFFSRGPADAKKTSGCTFNAGIRMEVSVFAAVMNSHKHDSQTGQEFPRLTFCPPIYKPYLPGKMLTKKSPSFKKILKNLRIKRYSGSSASLNSRIVGPKTVAAAFNYQQITELRACQSTGQVSSTLIGSSGGAAADTNSLPRRKASLIAEGCCFIRPGESILLTNRLAV